MATGGTFNVATSVSLGMVSGAAGTINVGRGATVKIGESLYVSREAGATGAVTLSAGATMTVGVDVAVGSGDPASPHGAGSLAINAGSTLDVGNRITVSAGSTLDMAGGTVSADTLIVGLTGAGTLDVGAGSHVNVAGAFDLGYDVGAVGTATLLSGSTVTVDGGAWIGGGDMASAAGTGSLTVEGTSTFLAQASLYVSNGSTVDLAGGTVSAALASGNVTVDAGGQVTGYGTLATGAELIDNGQIIANGGTLQLDGKVTGTGSVIINPDSTVAITGAALLTPTLTFMSGTDETLSLSSAADVKSVISGFNLGDQIEIAGVDSTVWSSSADTLTLSDAGKTVGMLHLSGSYSGDVFSLMHTGNLGVITLHTAS